MYLLYRMEVSTHSRPKAAGLAGRAIEFKEQFQHTAARRRLEGLAGVPGGRAAFQHTAARRRLGKDYNGNWTVWAFQHTAARRRLGQRNHCRGAYAKVSTHSRPKAAGTAAGTVSHQYRVSTHSRPKAAGYLSIDNYIYKVFQHTAARRRLARKPRAPALPYMFQHTAARRRLVARYYWR